MGILELLGVAGRGANAQASAPGHGDTDTVRRIVSELAALEPARARFLAAFAYVLSRVAHADSHISEDETEKMREIVQALGHLPDTQAVLVVEIAKGQATLFGGTENYLVTREFREIATAEQRLELRDCLFAVAVADGVTQDVKRTFQFSPVLCVLELGALAKAFESSIKAPRFVDKRT